MKFQLNFLVLGICCFFGALPGQLLAGDASKQAAIFDESADGSKQIADALVVAKKDGKHVLLDFGANWCIWCHRLHNLFESDTTIAAELKGNYGGAIFFL